MDNEHFSNKDIDAIDGKVSDNYFIPVFQDVLKEIKTAKEICDVGCGNGLFSLYLKDEIKDVNITGLDGSEYALELAKERGLTNTCKINDFCKDVLPVDSEKFDFVVCKDVFEHLLKPDFLVKQISHITKKDGYALIHVPNHFPIKGRLKLLFNNDIDPLGFFPDSKRWNFPHIRFFTRESLIELMSIEGFKVEKELSHHFVTWSKLFKYLPEDTINKNADLLSSGITILFKK